MMLLSKSIIGDTNEHDKLRIIYSDNSTEEFYINPKEFEPSIDINVQIQNALLKLNLKLNIKKAQIYTLRDGYETNTRVLKLKS
jgi:hypothetical protein